MALPPFQIKVRVEAEDIDRQNHVNNIVYLQWVQDVAVAHWLAAAPDYAQETILWVVLRHEIAYKAPALLGDELIVETRVGQASGITFERHVDILRATDGKVLARARTLWCPLHPETLRPQRIDAEIRDLFSTNDSS